jgi:hypothetical protein
MFWLPKGLKLTKIFAMAALLSTECQPIGGYLVRPTKGVKGPFWAQGNRSIGPETTQRMIGLPAAVGLGKD